MNEPLHAPVPRSLKTPGVAVAMLIMAIGVIFGFRRFVFGIGSVTNLTDQYPWGLWIAFDVATGVALAAGGFTTAALVYVFGRHRFHALVRPALLTAALGYTFVVIGLMADLGRYWAVWHPLLPSMWQGNSVLFEVGICVMCYLTVLYIEFFPIVLEHLERTLKNPKQIRFWHTLHGWLNRFLFVFILAGIVLSCLHQSSLGNLMVIAPNKMHPLWYTPLLPLLFLMSAIGVGFPMVIFESLLASRGLNRKAELDLLSPLSRYVAPILAVYLFTRLGDLIIRETWQHAFARDYHVIFFWAEILLGLILPILLFSLKKVRRSPALLLTASALYVIFGVALNRINVFLVAYHPPYADGAYVPALGEFAVSAGLVATLVLIYRIAVTNLPVMHVEEEAKP
jgi:Ni/Fe-hydrogenase subunit HybB-like protein